MIKYAAGYYFFIVSLFVPLEVMAQGFPQYLGFSPDQCPAAMSSDQPRNLFQPDTVDRVDGSPVRLVDEIRLVVAERAFVATRGFFFPTVYEEKLHRRLFGDFGSLGTLPPMVFWMPEPRPIERHPIPDWHYFCEAGREPPSIEQYMVSAQVHLPGSSTFDAARERRREWRRQVDAFLGSPIEDVLHGLAPERENRIVSGVVGAVTTDGLSAGGTEHPPPADPLRIHIVHVLSDGLYGRIRCPTSAAWDGAPYASFVSCEAYIGPADFDASEPDIEFRLPRNRLDDWPDIHGATTNIILRAQE